MIDETGGKRFQESKRDGISENGNGSDEALVHTETMVKSWLATLCFKEMDALKNSIIANDNSAKLNVLLRQLTKNKQLIKHSLNVYPIVTKLMVDYKTSRPSEISTSRIIGNAGFHCNDDNYFLSFSEDSRCLLSTGKDNSLIIWAKEDGRWREETIISNHSAVSSACFSPDSRHMVVAIHLGSVKIYSRGTDNKWKENCTVNRSVQATFSLDSRHLVFCNSKMIEIRSIDENENWVVKLYVDTQSEIKSAYFTDNSAYLICTYDTEPDKVFCREDDGCWKMQSSILANGKNTLLAATIWNDGLYMVASGTEGVNESATIFCMGTDGEWMEEAKITASVIAAVGTSVDGIHIVSRGCPSYDESIAKIWSLGKNGLFNVDILRVAKDADNGGGIDYSNTLDSKLYQVEFSNDGRHVGILYDERIILCSQNKVGEWIDKCTIEEQRSVRSLTFSADNTHMILSLMDSNRKNTFRVWNLGMDGEWEEDIILSASDEDVSSIVFSADGHNVGLVYDNGSVKIWGGNEELGQWHEKDCVTGFDLKKVVFSSDGLYVAVIGGEPMGVFDLKVDKGLFSKYFGPISRQLPRGFIGGLKALFVLGVFKCAVDAVIESRISVISAPY